MLDEMKYRNLFLNDFKASAIDYDKEFKRVIEENGYSEELKQDFYKAAFDSVIAVQKKNFVKNIYYKDRIITIYNIFIKALNEDDIDAAKFEVDLDNFLKVEFPSIQIDETTSIAESPIYKTYNPNTKYGRRKANEQARKNYAEGTSDYRNEMDNFKVVIWIIIIVIVIIFYVVKTKLSV